MRTPRHDSPETPRPPVQEIQKRLTEELSLPSHVGYTLLLLFDLAVAGAVGSLWLTEPSLPARTQVAFAGIFLAALAWAAYFVWTLARRKVLLARHRVVAARIAVTVTAAYTAGAVAVASTVPDLRATGMGAGAFGLLLLLVALLLLLRADRRYEALQCRRAELERQLAR